MIDLESSYQQSLADLWDKGTPVRKECPDEQLARLKEDCLLCTRCQLRQGCRQVVFGEGGPGSRLMLVGEGPGSEEDRLGKPFVGAAGQLLDRILEAVQIKRDEVYITNIVKCRPPANRAPAPSEITSCLPYLQQQIVLLNPLVIVCMGAVASRTLIGGAISITRLRGQWQNIEGRLLMPTFHPAALLRDPGKKRPVWEDFQQIAGRYRQLLKQESTDGQRKNFNC